MMSKKAKKLLCVLSASLCVVGASVPASADTITFNVTTGSDPYSYTVRKADSEQKFYVTGTYFSNSARLYCQSHKVSDTSVKGTTSISSSSPSSSGSYSKTAASGVYYELYTYASKTINVKGRYTP